MKYLVQSCDIVNAQQMFVIRKNVIHSFASVVIGNNTKQNKEKPFSDYDPGSAGFCRDLKVPMKGLC